MKRVEELSEEEKLTLIELKKNHPKYRERERAYGILLSCLVSPHYTGLGENRSNSLIPYEIFHHKGFWYHNIGS